MRKNATTVIATLALIIALTAGLVSVERSARAENTTKTAPRDTIRVTGSGKVFAPSDEATVSFGVRTVRSTSGRALNDNSIVANKVIAALKSKGLTDDEIKTGSVSLYPQQEWRPNRAPKILSYTAENRINVTTKKLDKLGDIMAAATVAGATETSNLSFRLSEDSDAKQDAIKVAVRNARKKAEALAEELGVHVGKPVSASEQIQQQSPIQPYNDELLLRGLPGSAKDVAPPIMPQDLQVNAEVTITFAMQ